MKSVFNKLLAVAVGIILSGSMSMAQNSINMDTQLYDKNDVIVELKTTMGEIVIELYNDTPLHRDNFIKLVENGTYDGVLFHRVIDNFMIQTGDPDSKTAKAGQMLGGGDLGYTVEAEIQYPKHYNKYGALAAARTGDNVNPKRRSSASQFYIVTGKPVSESQLENMQMRQHEQELQNKFRQLVVENKDTIETLRSKGDETALENLRQELIKETESSVDSRPLPENLKNDYLSKGGAPHLDGAYTVFGQVIKGMDIVEKIQKVETDVNDRPIEDIKLISAKIIKK